MNEQMEQILARLQEFSPVLYEQAIRVTVMEGWGQSVGGVLMIAVIAGAIHYVWTSAELDSLDATFTRGMTFALGPLFAVMALLLIFTGISKLLNPDYYALASLIGGGC